MQRLREGGVFTVVALYALVLEIFFGAMHAAALAAAAAGPARNPDSFIFAICTPQGLRTPSADELRQSNTGNSTGQPVRKAASDFCPVCGSAAASPFSMGRSPTIVAATVAYRHIRFAPPDERHLPQLVQGARRIRAPPPA